MTCYEENYNEKLKNKKIYIIIKLALVIIGIYLTKIHCDTTKLTVKELEKRWDKLENCSVEIYSKNSAPEKIIKVQKTKYKDGEVWVKFDDTWWKYKPGLENLQVINVWDNEGKLIKKYEIIKIKWTYFITGITTLVLGIFLLLIEIEEEDECGFVPAY